MGFFDSKTSREVLQTPEEEAARQYLSGTLDKGTPNMPSQEIAGRSKDEQTAQTMTRDFASGESEGLQHFRDVAGQGGNILDNPAYKALFDKISEAGSMETNRVGRSLQMRGGTTSSTGANVLGRTVEQGQSNLLAGLAPYQQAQDAMRMTAAQSLAQFGDSSILKRLDALGSSGELTRRLDQMQKDADFTRKTTMTMFPYQQGQSMADTILKNKADWSETTSPSMFSQIAEPVMRVGAAVATGGASELMSGITGALSGGAGGLMKMISGMRSGIDPKTGAARGAGEFGPAELEYGPQLPTK